jgi:hypothetical protein
MPERSLSRHRPRLEHRASQTLTIDLTDEPEEAPITTRNVSRPQRPPLLGRSDVLELADVIDLTDDNDVEITGVTSRHLPLPRLGVPRPSPPRQLRFDSPSLFVAQEHDVRHINRVFGEDGPFAGSLRIGPGQAEVLFRHSPAEIMNHLQMLGNVQAMPGIMDYQRGAFAERKPDHVPPPPAKDGFTRSPTEDDVVICPSCEEELVHHKDIEEPVIKKGKAPTKKEREEHPFWVLKECGHVMSSDSL